MTKTAYFPGTHTSLVVLLLNIL